MESIIFTGNYAMRAIFYREIYQAAEERQWFSSFPSEDGSTIVKMTYSEPFNVRDIGFFGPDGKERAVIAGRHVVYITRMSSDGYLAISGGIVGKDNTRMTMPAGGFYLSLYNPFGQLQWEIKTDDPISDFAISKKGHRTIVGCIGYRPGQREFTDSMLALNVKGQAFNKIQFVKGLRVQWLGFVGADKFVIATTGSDVRAFAPDDMHELWRTKIDIAGMASGGVALSSDLSRMAVLDAVVNHDTNEISWRVALLDAKNGKLLERKDLPVHEYLQPNQLRYDDKEKAFILKTKQARVKITSDGEVEKLQ